MVRRTFRRLLTLGIVGGTVWYVTKLFRGPPTTAFDGPATPWPPLVERADATPAVPAADATAPEASSDPSASASTTAPAAAPGSASATAPVAPQASGSSNAPAPAVGPENASGTTPAAPPPSASVSAAAAAAPPTSASASATAPAAPPEGASAPVTAGSADPAPVLSPPPAVPGSEAETEIDGTSSAVTTWVDAVAGDEPVGHPVKAKLKSGIYHLPGMLNYDRTVPDRWYTDAVAAEADGLRKAKR